MKKIAVIGYGGQGAWHCGQIAKSDVCTLAGTYDIREIRRQAAEKDGVRVYASNEEIFADPAVDAVVIAVPNDDHKVLVMKALEAGKHVICEKPVEMSCSSWALSMGSTGLPAALRIWLMRARASTAVRAMVAPETVRVVICAFIA